MPHRCVADVGNYTGWTPPFQYRIGYIPERDIVAAVSFKVEDEIGTEVMQRRAVAETLCIYNNDTYQLSKQKKDLSLAINDLVTAESWESAPHQLWEPFLDMEEAGFHRYTAKLPQSVWQILG